MKIDNYKLSIAIIVSVLSISYYKSDYNYKPQYEILDESDIAYGKYSDGLVYIGDKDYIDSLSDISYNDVVIYDNEKSMKIFSSYKIEDKNQRNDIINILKDYEIKNNTKNSRSIESMRMEWFVHNLLYKLNYKTERTRDVDFENKEEETYNKKVLSRFLKI